MCIDETWTLPSENFPNKEYTDILIIKLKLKIYHYDYEQRLGLLSKYTYTHRQGFMDYLIFRKWNKNKTPFLFLASV